MKVEEVIGFLAPIFPIGICVLLAMGYSDIVYDYVGTLYIWTVLFSVILFYRMFYFLGGGENNMTLSTIVWSFAIAISCLCIFLFRDYPDIIYYFGKSLIWSVGGGVILIYFVVYYQNWWKVYVEN